MLSKCAGQYFRVCTLVWVFRRNVDIPCPKPLGKLFFLGDLLSQVSGLAWMAKGFGTFINPCLLVVVAKLLNQPIEDRMVPSNRCPQLQEHHPHHIQAAPRYPSDIPRPPPKQTSAAPVATDSSPTPASAFLQPSS